MDILHSGVSQIACAVKSGAVHSVEVLDAFFARIDAVNPVVNAVVQSNRELAYQEARWIDMHRDRVQDLVLPGVPFTVKNTCAVRGYAPDKGCPGLANRPSEADATVVARLRAQGAVVLGLTNTPELSIGYETDNLLYGRTCNPFDPARSPGGSSGGESAIIAAGGSPLGIGSDASGSLRVPAHNTGIATLKMTQGRVPLSGHVPIDTMGLFSEFISFGPMARYIDDLVTVAPLLAGPDDLDPHVPPVPWRDPSEVDIGTIRVAYYADDGISVASDDVVATVEAAAAALRPEVAQITQRRPEVLPEMDALLSNSILLGGDEGEWLMDLIRRLDLKTPSPLLMEYHELARRCRMSVTELRWSWVRFDQCRRAMMQFMSDYDVVLCPVAATVAKPHGRSYPEVRDFSYSMCYSLVNWPSVVVRAGQSIDCLPIGIQVVAKPWREDVALAVAARIERLLGGYREPGFVQIGH
ncbi:amidase (plasmid) [Burkholderia glumae]|uniref:amidase n=1 Tax=Burkholderia glumae TaxID=337 RepID=UPI002151AC9E|nr:amidase [Burkholderia glumae]UVS82805.1 amidase [Burkholderia glumae]UVT00250.1 amidase [Burkholderia glumae]